jgi:hypothetical protein
MLSRRSLLLAALLALAPAALRAQAPDPSGHWVGRIQVPGGEIPFELDLARAGSGLIGAFTIDDVDALPLNQVTLTGRTLTFYSRADQPMTGTVSDDGTIVSGDATVSGYVLPFSMKRTGDARLRPPATSAAVSRELEGTWRGTLQANGLTLHALLTIANQPDGRALAHVVSVDEGGLVVPVVMVQSGTNVSYEQKGVPGSYSGTLSADGKRLSGTFTQRGTSLPLTFTREGQ